MNIIETASKFQIPLHSLYYWRDIGLLKTSSNHLDFNDLLKVRSISVLRKAGVSLQKIRKAIEQIPNWTKKLKLSHGILLENNIDGEWIGLDGQYHFHFERANISSRQDKQVLDFNPNIEIEELEKQYIKYVREENLKKMEESLLAILKINNKHLSTWIELGNLYFQQKEEAKTIHSYEQCLEIKATCPEALYNLANLHFKNKNFAIALRMYKDCISFNPNFIEAYYNYGLVLFSLNYFSKAKEVLESYVYFDPNSIWSEQARLVIEECKARETNTEKIPF